MQLRDIDVKRRVDVGKTILSLFLGVPNSRIAFIIRLKPRTEKNLLMSKYLELLLSLKINI